MSGLFPNIAGYRSGRTDFATQQRDKLVDPGCIGLFNFGHAWGYLAQASPIAAGTSLRNYSRSGGLAAVSGAPAWAGKMMLCTSVSHVALLPAEWKLPASATHFAFGGFLKIARTGYPTGGTGTGSAYIMGYCQTNGSVLQWGLFASYDKATGNLTALYAGANGQLLNVLSALPADCATVPYVYAIEFVVLTSTTFQIKFYVGSSTPAVTSAALAYSGTLAQPTSGAPGLGGFTVATSATLCSFGQVFMWDLSVAGSKSIADLITATMTGSGMGRYS